MVKYDGRHKVDRQSIEEEPIQVRSRIVARELKSGDSQTYMRELRVEARKAVTSSASSLSPEFSLMHVDVSRAYFHAKAQRLVLVKLPAEVCSGKDKREIELLTYQRCSKQWRMRLARASRALWLRAGAQFKKLVSQPEQDNFGFDTRRRFCGDRNEGESAGAQEAAGESAPNQLELHRGRFCKEYQCTESENALVETGIVHQHDHRHVYVPVESLGLENGNTVHTTTSKMRILL